MKQTLNLLIVFCALNAFGQDNKYYYCFESGPDSYSLYSVVNHKIYKIFGYRSQVSDVCISPDGKRLVYVTNSEKNFKNHLVIMDLSTRQKAVLNPHCMYAGYPVWSPDGKSLAYNAWDDHKKKYLPAIIDVATGKHRIVNDTIDTWTRCSWSSDSKSLIVNDQGVVLVINLAGKVNKVYHISDLMKTPTLSSIIDFRFTGYDKKIIFVAKMNEHGFETDHPDVVFSYDIASGETTRLSPIGLYCMDVAIVNDEIFFIGSTGYGPPKTNFYSVDPDGKNLKKLPERIAFSGKY